RRRRGRRQPAPLRLSAPAPFPVSLRPVEGSRLHERFARYCEVRSPTGEEREIADTLAAELRALGLEGVEDDAAGPAEAGAGNLIARSPGTGEGWVMFCAHVDTVPHRRQIEVVEDAGVFRSRG